MPAFSTSSAACSRPPTSAPDPARPRSRSVPAPIPPRTPDTRRTLSVAIRVIPCLDVNDGRVVKGVNFENLRDAGDPVELAHRYNEEGADELTFLDVTASKDGRGTIDDIDNLGNRRVRSVGELMENQYRVGLLRMERAIRERMGSVDIDSVMPHDLINAKPAAAAVRVAWTTQLSTEWPVMPEPGTSSQVMSVTFRPGSSSSHAQRNASEWMRSCLPICTGSESRVNFAWVPSS